MQRIVAAALAGTLASLAWVGLASAAPAPAPTAEPSASSLYAGTLPAVAPRGTVTARTITTADGLARTYRLFVPAGLEGTAPLLVALHGGMGSAEQFATNSGFDGLATSNRFIVAYPNGVGRLADGTGGLQTWNGGACCGPAATRAVDDVAFISAVVRDVSRAVRIDRDRVFATGHSNGGIMALRLACERAGTFAAVAVQSASLEVTDCRPSRPISAMQIHGDADTNLPIGGGRGSGLAGVSFAPPRAAAVTLAQLDGCERRVATRPSSSNPDLRLTTWRGCSDATTVEFLTVRTAGHAWMGHPLASPAAEQYVGKPYMGIDSSRAIWSFLRAHPRS